METAKTDEFVVMFKTGNGWEIAPVGSANEYTFAKKDAKKYAKSAAQGRQWKLVPVKKFPM